MSDPTPEHGDVSGAKYDGACQRCGLRTRRPTKVCRRCEPKTDAKRPERPCTGCGKRTTAKSGQCRDCEPTWAKQGPVKYEHAVWAEAPGQWVNVGGIQRWVPKAVA